MDFIVFIELGADRSRRDNGSDWNPFGILCNLKEAATVRVWIKMLHLDL